MSANKTCTKVVSKLWVLRQLSQYAGSAPTGRRTGVSDSRVKTRKSENVLLWRVISTVMSKLQNFSRVIMAALRGRCAHCIYRRRMK